ncbi:MAG: respiratory chain complex I subunit 1 family protein [Gemmatimonadales bacterium]
MTPSSVVALGIVLVLAPALPGLATRTKSWLTGRRGPPILQLYFEIAKLLRKKTVYSATTTWVFRLAPVVGLAGGLLAASLLPLDGRASLAGFAGDFVLFAGLLALGRFFLILAALDTGSSFEGMGASREAMVGAFAEVGLFLVFAALVLATGRLSLSDMLGAPLAAAWSASLPPLVMVGVGLFVLLLAEAGRVPVDDPATHLELTMIHEVAVLDQSGPDFALVLYGAALKFALLAVLVASVLAPRAALEPTASLIALPAGLLVIAAFVGVVEGVMARLRLNRVPQLLVAASALAAFATILLLGHP